MMQDHPLQHRQHQGRYGIFYASTINGSETFAGWRCFAKQRCEAAGPAADVARRVIGIARRPQFDGAGRARTVGLGRRVGAFNVCALQSAGFNRRSDICPNINHSMLDHGSPAALPPPIGGRFLSRDGQPMTFRNQKGSVAGQQGLFVGACRASPQIGAQNTAANPMARRRRCGAHTRDHRSRCVAHAASGWSCDCSARRRGVGLC